MHRVLAVCFLVIALPMMAGTQDAQVLTELEAILQTLELGLTELEAAQIQLETGLMKSYQGLDYLYQELNISQTALNSLELSFSDYETKAEARIVQLERGNKFLKWGLIITGVTCMGGLFFSIFGRQ